MGTKFRQKKFYGLTFANDLQKLISWKINFLQQKIHSVFVDFWERVILLSSHKIDVKEDITLQHDVNKNEDIKQLHSGKHANSTNSVRNLPYFSLSCDHNIETYGGIRYSIAHFLA